MQINKEATARWTLSGPGAERRVMAENAELMMVEFRFEKGGEGLPHSHPRVQTTYVMSGRFEFTVKEDTRVLEPGDAMLIPSK